MQSTGTWLDPSELNAPLTPEISTSMPLVPASASVLRIVSYNIKDGGVDPALIAAAFKANANLATADIIMIQEAEAFPEEPSTRISQLASALDMAWIYAPARPEKTGTLGDAIISRYPLEDFAVMRLAFVPTKHQRIAVAGTLRIGDVAIRLVTTQLDTTLNITDRILQLRPVVIDLPSPSIVGGDMNTNPYAWQGNQVPLIPTSQVVDTDQAPMLDDYMQQIGFANPIAPLGNTEVKFGIASRLDAVFVSGLEPINAGVERDITLSDHWPVWTDVRIQP